MGSHRSSRMQPNPYRTPVTQIETITPRITLRAHAQNNPYIAHKRARAICICALSCARATHPPTMSPWAQIACRWRPEECGKQSEHGGTRACGCGHVHVRHTFPRTATLAVQKDPPSPAARLGPIHAMGRTVRCRAHALRSRVH